jgi:pimeloyl-ACP methyl ester carboxylesterase
MDGMAVGVKGIEAFCSDQGVGHALLFVHGWGGWHGYWRHLWPTAVPRFRSLAVDLPGFGLSEKPAAEYTVEWLAEWLVGLLDAKGIRRAVLVGHSMGGMIATVLAARHPERVERLVTINAPAHGPTAFSRRVRMMSAPGVGAVCRGLMVFDPMLRWIAKDFTATRPLGEQDLEPVRMASYRALSRTLASMKGTDAAVLGALVQAPTLVLTSEEDRIVDPGQGAVLARSIAGATERVLRGLGHCAPLEGPEAVGEALFAFLEGVPRPGRPRKW